MPAAVPTATASVGDTSNAITASVATPMPRKIAGNTGPPRKPQPRQIAYAIALAASRSTHDPGRVLRTSFGHRGLAGEEHVLRVGAERLGEQREQAHREAAPEQERRHAGRRLRSHPLRRAPDDGDEQRGGTPTTTARKIDEVRPLVGGKAGDTQRGRFQPAPVAEADEEQ